MSQEIVLIAPDKKMALKARNTMREAHDQIGILEGSLDVGAELAKKAVEKGAKVIISRGGTAKMIREIINETVVEVEYTGYDIVYALNNCMKFTNKIGVVAFEKVINSFKKLKNIFPVELSLAEVASGEEIAESVSKLIEQGSEIIIGGATVIKVTEKLNQMGLLLETGEEAIRGAVQKAKEIYRIQTQEREKSSLLKAIVDFAHDGIISIDLEGKVTMFNPSAGMLVGVKPAGAIGKHINEVIPRSGLLKVLHSGKADLSQVVEIGGNKIILNRIPIFANDGIKGAVGTFQEVKKLQIMERKIREKIYMKGHVAKYNLQDIIGKSELICETKKRAMRYASVDSNVLLIGETGTGKELFAQSIHRHSRRSKGPFVAVNCAALPENLLESELFGYVGGAFTGARKEGKIGLFELAHNGTIFLDEISEMSLKLQARFLRVIEEKEVTRIGDDKVIPIDIRILASSNRKIQDYVSKGNFREDLYYRLCVLLLTVPPLRDRRDDIVELARHFIREKAKELDKKELKITSQAISLITRYSWPGNVRQLVNLIERIVVLSEKNVIDCNMVIGALAEWGFHVGREELNLLTDAPAEGVLQRIETETIKKVLAEAKGNKTLAAKRLGISTTTLWRKLRAMKCLNNDA